MFADFLELLLAYLRLSPDQTQAAPSNATLVAEKPGWLQRRMVVATYFCVTDVPAKLDNSQPLLPPLLCFLRTETKRTRSLRRNPAHQGIK